MLSAQHLPLVATSGASAELLNIAGRTATTVTPITARLHLGALSYEHPTWELVKPGVRVSEDVVVATIHRAPREMAERECQRAQKWARGAFLREVVELEGMP